MMNRQQADALRRENEARSSAQWQKTQASFAASNQRAQQQHQASQQAAGTAAHNARMKEYARGGEALRRSLSEPVNYGGRTSIRDYSGSSGGGSTGKSKGGALFLALIVIGVIVIAKSDSHKAGTAEQPAPAAYSAAEATTTAQPPAQAPVAEQTAPAQETTANQSPAEPLPQDTLPPAPAPAAQTQSPNDSPAVSEPPTPVATTLPPLEVVSRVSPQYPEMARNSGIHGTVAVAVQVSPYGAVVNMKPESGNPILVQAALYAARQWRFNPYAASPGDPLRTTTINFKFGEE